MPKTTTKKQKIVFSLTAPEAKSVSLMGDFTEWEVKPVALKKQKNGLWKTTVSLSPGTYEYRFNVDGEWRDDPACNILRPNSYGTHNCVCSVDAGAM